MPESGIDDCIPGSMQDALSDLISSEELREQMPAQSSASVTSDCIEAFIGDDGHGRGGLQFQRVSFEVDGRLPPIRYVSVLSFVWRCFLVGSVVEALAPGEQELPKKLNIIRNIKKLAMASYLGHDVHKENMKHHQRHFRVS